MEASGLPDVRAYQVLCKCVRSILGAMQVQVQGNAARHGYGLEGLCAALYLLPYRERNPTKKHAEVEYRCG